MNDVYRKIKKNKGFTLIELLAVIAIIGILASVILVNLGGVGSKARAANVQVSLMSLTSAIRTCVDSDETLLASYDDPSFDRCNYGCINGICDTETTLVPQAGQIICRISSKTWPDINSKHAWSYTPTNGQNGDVGCIASSTIDHWLFRADDTESGRYIICDELGCKSYNTGGYLPN